MVHGKSSTVLQLGYPLSSYTRIIDGVDSILFCSGFPGLIPPNATLVL